MVVLVLVIIAHYCKIEMYLGLLLLFLNECIHVLYCFTMKGFVLKYYGLYCFISIDTNSNFPNEY